MIVTLGLITNAKTKLRAYADVSFQAVNVMDKSEPVEITIKDFHVIEGVDKQGQANFFVKGPQRQYRKEGEDKPAYANIVQCGKNTWEAISSKILSIYADKIKA
jgi:hypothetical protein